MLLQEVEVTEGHILCGSCVNVGSAVQGSEQEGRAYCCPCLLVQTPGQSKNVSALSYADLTETEFAYPLQNMDIKRVPSKAGLTK